MSARADAPLPPVVWLAAGEDVELDDLVRGLDNAAAAGVALQVVVTHHGLGLPARPDVRLVEVEPGAMQGMLATFQVGWAALAKELPDSVFVALASRPDASPETYQAMARAHEGLACDWKPRYQGKHGHPILLGPWSLDRAAELDPATHTARDLVMNPASLDVEDPGILGP